MGIQMKVVYHGKAKDLTLKELWLLYKFGRRTENLETTDFNKN